MHFHKKQIKTQVKIYLTLLASGAPATRKTNGDPGTCCPAYLIVSACRPDSCGLTLSVKVASP